MIHLGNLPVGREHAEAIQRLAMDQEDPVLVSIRLAPFLCEEAENLIPHLAKDKSSHLALGGKVTRTDVFRLAIVAGLEQLKSKYEEPK